MIAWLLMATAALAASLQGTIKQAGSGEPLSDTEILINSQSLTTDAMGGFVLMLDPGTHGLSIRSDAYKPVDLSVTIPSSDELLIFVYPIEINGEIVVEAFRTTSHPSRHLVDGELARKTPGTLEDSIRLVQSLPSVAVQRELSPTGGDLSVRGSRPGDNRYYLDGVELPYLYHFNQYASVFPARMIDTLELFPSTYGASYGDSVGAIIEATSKTPTTKVLHGGAFVNMIMAGGDFHTPVGQRWNLAGSVRRSYQDLAGEQTEQYTVWPTFWDYALRAQHSDAAGEKTTQLFAYGAGDRYTRAVGELDILDPYEVSTVPKFAFNRRFHVAGARVAWDEAERQGRVVAALVDDKLTGQLDGGGFEELHTIYLSSRTDTRWELGPKLVLESGAELRMEHSAMQAQPNGFYGLLVARDAPELARNATVDDALLRTRVGLYVTGHQIIGKFRFMPSMRLAADTLDSSLLPEPRFAMRWHLAPQTEIKLAAGRYHQSPKTRQWLTDNTLPTASSWQVAAGLEQTVAQRMEILLDLYGKSQRDVVFEPMLGPLEVHPQARSVGSELILRYRIKDVIAMWSWLGLSRTELYRDGQWIPGNMDQPISGGLTTTWDFHPAWNLGLRYRFGSGLPMTPIAESLYDATEDTWMPVRGDENSLRMPFYQKIDLHLEVTKRFQRFSVSGYFELWFVPKTSAALYPTWSYDWSEQGWVRGPVILPLFGMQATF